MELSAQGTLPTAGGDMNAEPITDTLNHILSQVNGMNIDENNVDYSGADGIMVLARTQTRTAALTILNTLTIGVNDTGHDVKFFGATTGKSMLWDESADKLIVTGDFSSSGTTTLPTGTIVGTLTLASGSITDSSGAITFSNENLSTTGTFSAGTTTVTSLLNSVNDGGAIGASGTAFSDLFLASGAVVNFSAGNVTLTHSAGLLTLLGGGVTVGVDDTGYDVKMFGATAGKFLLWDESEDTLLLNDNTILTFGTGADADIYYDGTNLIINPAVVGSGKVIVQHASTPYFQVSDTTNPTTLSFLCDNDTCIIRSETAHPILFGYNTVEFMRLAAGGILHVGDTANTFMTQGINIYQGASDNEITAWKSSDVAHGITTNLETDTFGTIKKAVATLGGLEVRGATEHSSQALTLMGYTGATTNTDKTTAGYGAVRITAQEITGTTVGVVSADGNLCSIDSDGTVRFIFDVEGSAHADVAWTTFDTEDDFQLIKDVEANLVPDIFGEAVRYKEDDLVALGLFGKDSIRVEPNGRKRGMMNQTRMVMLHHGALNKMVDAFRNMESRLFVAENKLKMLEA